MNATHWAALIGGAVLGGTISLVSILTGRSVGVSGMAGATLSGRRDDRGFAAAFLAGLVAGGGVLAALFSGVAADASGRPAFAFAIGGLLIGWGARRANGCTSGHGVLGISHASARSFVAVALFAITASLVVAIYPAGGGS